MLLSSSAFIFTLFIVISPALYADNSQPSMGELCREVSDRKPLGRVLLMGGIHGDEYSTVSIVFKWMDTLNEYHSGLFHWKVTPLLNPDGLLTEGRAQRQNGRGVDLNRNLSSKDWDDLALKYWEKRSAQNTLTQHYLKAANNK
jgi:predicted deacylase